MTASRRRVTGGFDTHADINVGAVFDSISLRPVDRASFATTAAGINPERLHSEAGFVKLCAACPQPASSGKTIRYRLDRSDDRRANEALAPDRDRADALSRTHPPLRRPEVGRGQDPPRDHPLPRRFVAREIVAAIIIPPDNIPTGAQVRSSSRSRDLDDRPRPSTRRHTDHHVAPRTRTRPQTPTTRPSPHSPGGSHLKRQPERGWSRLRDRSVVTGQKAPRLVARWKSAPPPRSTVLVWRRAGGRFDGDIAKPLVDRVHDGPEVLSASDLQSLCGFVSSEQHCFELERIKRVILKLRDPALPAVKSGNGRVRHRCSLTHAEKIHTRP